MWTTRNGDLLEFGPPNELGESCIVLNGKVLQRVLFSGDESYFATLGDGRVIHSAQEFAEVIKAEVQWALSTWSWQ